MSGPYYADDLVTLYLGDCREVTEWLAADVLVTDPPYGRGWDRKRGSTWAKRTGRLNGYAMPAGLPTRIAGDDDTETRDEALALWTPRLAIVFGDFDIPKPDGTVQRLVYRKAPDSGTHGTHAGFRHDIECIYLVGPWPAALGGRSSVIGTSARSQGSDHGVAARSGHPHAKPVDVMETLISACPPTRIIADPFAGSGSTLIAARNLGRPCIGVEIDEESAEKAARRLSQMVLDFGGEGSVA